MHVTGWVLGAFTAEALKKCGASCTRELLDKALRGDQDRHPGPHRRADRDMSADDHYGTTYWRLYHWETDKLVGVGDWLRKRRSTFPAK